MPKGKAKTRFNFKTERCEFEDATYITLKTGKKELLGISNWCNLPKLKRCEDCIRCADGSKACMVRI